MRINCNNCWQSWYVTCSPFLLLCINLICYDVSALGGPFVLVDAADGLPVTDSKYRGDFLLLYFGFTHCPDICPNELVKLGKLIDNLDKRKMPQIKPVFISVDPQRDTVGQMRHYGVDFHPSLDWLTGGYILMCAEMLTR